MKCEVLETVAQRQGSLPGDVPFTHPPPTALHPRPKFPGLQWTHKLHPRHSGPGRFCTGITYFPASCPSHHVDCPFLSLLSGTQPISSSVNPNCFMRI